MLIVIFLQCLTGLHFAVIVTSKVNLVVYSYGQLTQIHPEVDEYKMAYAQVCVTDIEA